MRNLPDKPRGRFARDAYAWLHFPIVVGIVLFAVGAEEVVAHPVLPLDTFSRFAMSAGAALVVLGVAAIAYRAYRAILRERIAAAMLLLLLAATGASIDARWFAAIAATILIASLVAEDASVGRRKPVAKEPGRS